jgi:xylan 1,4-beta-xylosidase
VQGDTLAALVWHYHDDDLPGPDARVELTFDGLPSNDRPVLVEHYRIDRDHGNAFEAWKRMGSPASPTPDQRAGLERASALTLLTSPAWRRPENGRLTLRFDLPRQGVSHVVIRRGDGE